MATKYTQGTQVQARSIVIGGFYEYPYLPDPENRVPAYDPFPLILCVERRGKYVGGLNFHWLKKSTRRILLKAIMNSGGSANSVTKLDVPVSVIKAAYHLYKMENFRTRSALRIPIEKMPAKIEDDYYNIEGMSQQKALNMQERKAGGETNRITVRRMPDTQSSWIVVDMKTITRVGARTILEKNKVLSPAIIKRLRSRFGVVVSTKEGEDAAA